MVLDDDLPTTGSFLAVGFDRAVLTAAGLLAGAAVACLLPLVTWPRVALAALGGGLLGALLPSRTSAAGPADRAAVPSPSLLCRLEPFAPLVLLLFVIPLFTLAVPPGADMTAHVAMARGIVEGQGRLGPVWGDLRVTVFPRGLSCIVALFAPAMGLARAGLMAAVLSFAVWYFGARAFFRDALRLPAPGVVAAFILVAFENPQGFFNWGGDPCALAMGLSLLGAALCARPGSRPLRDGVLASLLLVGALLTHPVGALSGTACLAPGMFREARANPSRTIAIFAIVLTPLLLAGLYVHHYGPAVSPAEVAWIQKFTRNPENVLRLSNRLLFPLTVWVAFVGELGPLALVVFVAAMGVESRSDAGRRRIGKALMAIFALGFVFAAGPYIPILDVLLFPRRLVPLLALAIAPTLAYAAERALAAPPSSWPRMTRLFVGATMAAAAGVHLFVYQLVRGSTATFTDLESLRCIEHTLPANAVFEGAYGDATSWIPALTGRRIVNPQSHCTLADETAASLAGLRPTWRFVGERIAWDHPFEREPPAVEPVCRFGKAGAYRLP